MVAAIPAPSASPRRRAQASPHIGNMSTTAKLEQDTLELARAIHAKHVVVDSLAPSFIAESVMTPAMVALAREQQAQGKKRSAIQAALADYLVEHCASDRGTRDLYLEYWRRSGVTACNNTLYASGPPDMAWDALVTEFGRAQRMIDALDGEVVVATKATDIANAHRDGRLAVMYNIQNPEPLGARLERVDTLYGLGLRSMQLTYNLRTRFGEGCLEPNDGGMSRLGHALVDKLNDIRMIVDVSHASARTAADAAVASKQPVIASHTGARAISGHARALPDEVLKAIADGGGYVGVVILPAFIVRQDDDRATQFGKPAGWATLDAVVDHVVHLLNVIGKDHVGIGTDWGKPYYTALTWTADMVNE
ncbi:MAG: membrane dipeptidase, partial [Casimicrobiaceae bacterium]